MNGATGGATDGAGESALRDEARQAPGTVAVLLLEALPLAVLAGLFAKMIGAHAEGPSVWAVLLLVFGGFATSRWLAEPSRSDRWRWIFGAVITIVAVQTVARVDLSETARIWDFGWVVDLGKGGSDAWRRFGSADHLLSGVALVAVWFRGVRLGGIDLENHSLVRAAMVGFAIFALGFSAGDGAGIISTVRITALIFLGAGLAAVAFRTAAQRQLGRPGGLSTTGLSFLSTLGVMIVLALIFMLLATAVLAAVAGSGIADPVSSALADALRVLAMGLGYLFLPLIWLFQFILSGASDTAFELPPFFQNLGIEDGEVTAGEESAPSKLGPLLVRVFGAIGVILLFALIVFFVFRRFVRRGAAQDEERESIWGEATLLGDLKQALRSLRGRIPTRRAGSSDAAIAELYFDVLDDAARRGAVRHPSRTPLQFAPVLARTYRSDVPSEISRRFSELRYAERDSDDADLRRLRSAWREIKRRIGPPA